MKSTDISDLEAAELLKEPDIKKATKIMKKVARQLHIICDMCFSDDGDMNKRNWKK